MSTLVKCNVLCPDCKVSHYKDPHRLGDYTVEGQLLSFCPKCGKMFPFLSEEFSPEILSRNQKKKIGVIQAKKYNLNYRAINKIIRQLPDDRGRFVESLCFRVKIEFGVEIRGFQLDNEINEIFQKVD